MNWQEVKKYPKAWELFGDFVYYTIGNYNVELPETFSSEYVNFWIGDKYQDGKVTVHYRKLYDFFDEQGIKVFIAPAEYRWLIKIQYLPVFYIGNNKIAFEKPLDTRTEAEEQAFTKAFEILEDKLKEGR